MELHDNPADAEFRTEVRSFLRQTQRELFPSSVACDGWYSHDRGAFQRWSRAVDRKGWLVPTWPREWGGADWTPAWSRIFDEECCAARCPPRDMIGIGFVGPVIYNFGTQEQRERFLPRIRNADDIWCQGFSEPQAGSDTMALRTMAVHNNNHFVVDGQKLWISNAHNADMMFALVRVESAGNRRQQGLTFLLIDMHAPGITVRPVISIDGRHWVNEVFLDNVKVPSENLVGEQGKGWIYARFLLTNERMIVAALPLMRQQVHNLKELFAVERREGKLIAEDQSICLPLAQLEIEMQALDAMEHRLMVARAESDVVDRLAPMFKLRATELRQRISEFALTALGERALELSEDLAEKDLFGASTYHRQLSRDATRNYLFHRSATIAGGTSEIQRNIIASNALSL